MWYFAVIVASVALHAEPLNDKLGQFVKMSRDKTALTQDKQELKEEILAAMSADAVETAEYKAMRKRKIAVRTTLDEARAVSAVKTVEVVDRKKCKELYLSGVAVAGVEEEEALVVKKK